MGRREGGFLVTRESPMVMIICETIDCLLRVWDEGEAYLKRKADKKESHYSVSEKNY